MYISTLIFYFIPMVIKSSMSASRLRRGGREWGKGMGMGGLGGQSKTSDTSLTYIFELEVKM